MRLWARLVTFLVAAALVALFALAGLVAGPALARLNYTVELARQVEAGETFEAGTLEADRLKAFEALENKDKSDELRRSAAEIVATFRLGGALLGAWCGLVAALKLAALRRFPRRTEHEIDHGRCVACGRCFLSCPKEHVRLKTLAAARAAQAPIPARRDRGQAGATGD
jgi:ferredoxin